MTPEQLTQLRALNMAHRCMPAAILDLKKLKGPPPPRYARSKYVPHVGKKQLLRLNAREAISPA